MSKYGSVLKLMRTGTLALPFEVGPANNCRGFRSADGPRPQTCLFGRSTDHPRPQENLRIQVRGYPRLQSAHLCCGHRVIVFVSRGVSVLSPSFRQYQLSQVRDSHTGWPLVMEFRKIIFQTWKVIENRKRHGKSWIMMMMSCNFYNCTEQFCKKNIQY